MPPQAFVVRELGQVQRQADHGCCYGGQGLLTDSLIVYRIDAFAKFTSRIADRAVCDKGVRAPCCQCVLESKWRYATIHSLLRHDCRKNCRVHNSIFQKNLRVKRSSRLTLIDHKSSGCDAGVCRGCSADASLHLLHSRDQFNPPNHQITWSTTLAVDVTRERRTSREVTLLEDGS